MNIINSFNVFELYDINLYFLGVCPLLEASVFDDKFSMKNACNNYTTIITIIRCCRTHI